MQAALVDSPTAAGCVADAWASVGACNGIARIYPVATLAASWPDDLWLWQFALALVANHTTQSSSTLQLAGLYCGATVNGNGTVSGSVGVKSS